MLHLTILLGLQPLMDPVSVNILAGGHCCALCVCVSRVSSPNPLHSGVGGDSGSRRGMRKMQPSLLKGLYQYDERDMSNFAASTTY